MLWRHNHDSLVGSIWHERSYSSFSDSLLADVKYAIIYVKYKEMYVVEVVS